MISRTTRAGGTENRAVGVGPGTLAVSEPASVKVLARAVPAYAETAASVGLVEIPLECAGPFRPGIPCFVQIHSTQVRNRAPVAACVYEPVVVAVELGTPVPPALVPALGALPAL